MQPVNGISVEELKDMIPEVYAIGDCIRPRHVMSAIWEGYRTARLI
jgi:pyruvate/2-oxoglutarate dehydrogenase complex dihydrolipoamide dehydrogenase (E3) component